MATTGTFFLVLPSNTPSFENNKTSDFRVILPKPLSFDSEYVCALQSIVYPNSWSSVGALENQSITLIRRGDERIEIPVSKGNFYLEEDLVDSLNKTIGDGIKTLQQGHALPVPDTRVVRKKRAATTGPSDETAKKADNEQAARRAAQERDRQALQQAEKDALAKRQQQQAEQTRLAGERQVQETVKKADEANKATLEREAKQKEDEAKLAAANQKAKQDQERLQKEEEARRSATARQKEAENLAAANQKAKQDQERLQKEEQARIAIAEEARNKQEEAQRAADKQARERKIAEDRAALALAEQSAQQEKDQQKEHNLSSLEKANKDQAEERRLARLRDETSLKSLHLTHGLRTDCVNFVFDKHTQRVRIEISDSAIAKIEISPQLAYTLGFEPSDILVHNFSAKYKTDLSGGINHLAVYIEGLTENVIFGDRLTPLLRLVTIRGRPGDIVEQIYDQPLYLRVVVREVSYLRVQIRTMEGRLVPFDYGTVVLTLLFKRSMLF